MLGVQQLCFPGWVILTSTNFLQVCSENVHPPLLAASIFKFDRGIPLQ